MTRLFTCAEVADAGNDPDVAFGADQQFRLGTVPVPTDGSVATLQSYVDERDFAFAHAVLDLMDAYLTHGPEAAPPVVASRTGYVHDGSHRLCAAQEFGWTSIAAFVAVDREPDTP